jgi:hypothetical protein
MSFYFSRPVASASIWFGKLTAGILILVGCFGVIVAPAWLVTGREWKSYLNTTLGEGSAIVLTVALSLFLIAHVIGTFARSRSPLIVFDFAAAVVCGVAIRFLVLPLAAGQAIILIKWLSIALAIALVVAIVAGGAWQLEHGRTDRRRNHLALSQFLWSVMALALLIAGAYVAWVVSVKPSDIVKSPVESRSPGGPFLTIAGTVPSHGDYAAAWLMNTDDGRNIRIDARSAWGVQYTRDGRSAFWPVLNGNVAELRRYTRGEREPVDTGLTVSGDFIFLSDDGARIATLNRGILSIYDVAQKRSLVSARVPLVRLARGCFLSPDRFRLYAQTDSGLQIFDLDASTHSLRSTGGIGSVPYVFISLDPTGTRMVVKQARSHVVTLNDAATGAVIRTLLNGTKVSVARSLRDGRIVIIDGPVMHLLAPDGSPIRDIAGLSGLNWFVGDDGTRVVLMTRTGNAALELIAVDLNRGSIERRESGVGDGVGGGWFDVRPPIEPLREVVYKDMENHIVAWNPATGAKRRVT